MQQPYSHEDFFNDIKGANILFVFGSGISVALTEKDLSWREWLKTGFNYITDSRQKSALYDRLNKAASTDELTSIAEELIATLKQEGVYQQWMQTSFENLEIKKPDIATILKKLTTIPQIRFATTNYDLLLEQATGLPPCSGNVSSENRQETNSSVFGGEPAILHLHGYFDSRNNRDDIVASKEQYEKLGHNSASQFTQQLLSALNIMIFVGCGATVEDDNIAPMTTFAQKILGLGGTHYFLRCSQEKQKLPDTVRPVEYGVSYDDLLPFLEKIYSELSPSLILNVGKLGGLGRIDIPTTQSVAPSTNETRKEQQKIALLSLKDRHQELPHEKQGIAIDSFITRKVLLTSENGKNELDFLAWAKDFKELPCRVKVLEAPAGFGKTGLLEQLYYNLLENPLSGLPPLFISCISPYRNGDIGNYLSDIGSSLLNAFDRYEAYFLIDGFDELDPESQNALLSDLNRIVSFGATYKTYALISVRQNQLDRSAFTSKFKGVQFASIKPLTDDDIREIAIRAKMDESQVASFMNSISEEDHAYNIFYVSTAINYFMQKGELGDRVRLLEFQIKKDIEMLSRGIHRPIPQVLIAKALNRILANRDMPENCNAFDGIPANRVNFSHRNIEEYLTAKAIARLELNQIIRLISEDGIVIPGLRNMASLILMILASSENKEEQSKYNDLLRLLSNNLINLEIIMSSDTDSLSLKVRENLMELVVDYYTKEAKYNFPESLISFIDDNLKQFRKTVFKRLESQAENQSELLHLLNIVSSSNQNCLDETELNRIIDMFFNLAGASASKHVEELKLLSLMLRHNCTRIKPFSQMKIAKLVSLATNDIVNNAQELFMSICSMLSNSASRLKVNDYLMLLDKYFDIKAANVISGYSVPQQIDEDFNPQSYLIFSQYPFLDFSDIYFKLHEKAFITFVQKYCEYLKSNRYDIYSKEISHLMIKWLYKAIAEHNQKDESVMRFLEVCQKQYEKNTTDGILPLFNEMESDAQWDYVTARIITTAFRRKKSLDNQFDYFILTDLFDKLFKKSSLFNACLALISKDRTGDLLEFAYQSVSISADDIPEDVLTRIPTSLLECIREQHRKRIEFIELDLKHKDMIKTAFHIAYDDNLLIKEVKAIFELAEKRNVFISYLNRDENYNYTLVNQFLIDTIFKSQSTTSQQFLDFWFDKKNCQFKRILCIASYLHFHNLSFSLLNEEEIEDILDFTRKTINSKRFRYNTWAAILLSYLARQKELQPHLDQLLKNNDRMLDLIPICGLERMYLFHETVVVSNKDCPIEFLIDYIDITNLLDYIENNWKILLKKNITRTAIFNLFCTHSSDIPAQRKQEFKAKIIEFMKDSFGKEMFVPEDLYSTFEICSSDFTVTEICKGIKYPKESSDESLTLAINILRRFERSTDKTDRNMAIRCLETLFNREKNIQRKKDFAERYILLKDDNATMNHFLARYYNSTDSTISSWLRMRPFAFGTMDSLDDICILFENSLEKNKDKYQLFQRIAMSSFIRIRDNLIKNGSIQEIKYLLERMEKLHKQCPSISLQQAILDTRLQYATAKHVIPTYEEIDCIPNTAQVIARAHQTPCSEQYH